VVWRLHHKRRECGGSGCSCRHDSGLSSCCTKVSKSALPFKYTGGICEVRATYERRRTGPKHRRIVCLRVA